MEDYILQWMNKASAKGKKNLKAIDAQLNTTECSTTQSSPSQFNPALSKTQVTTKSAYNDNDNNNHDIEKSNSGMFTMPHCVATCLQHVRSSGQDAMVCKSRATHRPHRTLITCNMCTTWYEGTPQLFSLTELKSRLLHFND